MSAKVSGVASDPAGQEPIPAAAPARGQPGDGASTGLVPVRRNPARRQRPVAGKIGLGERFPEPNADADVEWRSTRASEPALERRAFFTLASAAS